MNSLAPQIVGEQFGDHAIKKKRPTGSMHEIAKWMGEGEARASQTRSGENHLSASFSVALSLVRVCVVVQAI